MLNKERTHPAGMTAHVTARAIPDRLCCPNAEARARLLQLALDLSWQDPCNIHAYALMDNHLHLLLTGTRDGAMGRLLMRLLGIHTTLLNRAEDRVGPCWRGRYSLTPIRNERHLLNSHLYIESNPWRAALVDHPAQSPWTSYHHNAMACHDELITPHEQILAMGFGGMTWHDAYSDAMERYLKWAARYKTPTGRPLYSDPLAGLHVYGVDLR